MWIEGRNMVPILDNGHGGVINGIYQTPGKRSPDWDLGVLYEGMFNRWMVNGVIECLDSIGLPYFHVSPELTDIALDERCERANHIFEQNPNTYLLSIHGNAGGGTGIEAWTSIGQTESDKIADAFLENLSFDLPNETMRFDYFRDNDRDKEANYKILRKTNCPAVLVELWFMDNELDYRKQWDKWHRQEAINSIVGTIKKLYGA